MWYWVEIHPHGANTGSKKEDENGKMFLKYKKSHLIECKLENDSVRGGWSLLTFSL